MLRFAVGGIFPVLVSKKCALEQEREFDHGYRGKAKGEGRAEMATSDQGEQEKNFFFSKHGKGKRTRKQKFRARGTWQQ